MVCAAVAAIPIIYFLAYGSIPFFSDGAAAAADPAVPPRIQRLRARTRTIVRALITFFVCLYAVVLFPQTLWNALQATISYVVPSSAFGLVDRDTYERVKEETTDREVCDAPQCWPHRRRPHTDALAASVAAACTAARRCPLTAALRRPPPPSAA
eukprot:1350315-Prymnesium_polylepis.1